MQVCKEPGFAVDQNYLMPAADLSVLVTQLCMLLYGLACNADFRAYMCIRAACDLGATQAVSPP
jgi:hypothetical protein